MAAICPNFSYNNPLGYMEECIQDDAPQEMPSLPTLSEAQMLGFLTGALCLFPVAASLVDTRRVGEAFAMSVSRRSHPLFFKIAVFGAHTLATGLLAAIPGIFPKVVQKWNISDLSAKMAEFVMHTIGSGFFFTSVAFWVEVVFAAHREEIFGMPTGLITNRPTSLRANLLPKLPGAAPAA